jgi:TP901 family phage tail tape measure protein
MTTLAVSIEVGAVLKDGLKTAFSEVETASAALDREIGQLNQTAATMTGWREAKRQTADARVAWKSAQQQAAELEQQLDQTASPSRELRAELTRAQQRVDTTKTAWRSAASELRRFDGDMQAAGIEARTYSANLKHVETAVEQLTRKQKALGQAQARADTARADRDALGGEVLGAVAAVGAVAMPVKLAIDYSAAMADVRKVTGLSREETKALGIETRRALADQKIALSQIEAAAIMEGAGQAGLARDELVGFTTDVAKAKVAMGFTAEEAADIFVGWRSSMGLTQEQAISLADAVNYMSDNSGADAAGLAQVIARQGAVAQSAGLAREEIVALSSFMLSSKQGPEVTATALKNLTGSLAAGIAATGRQEEAFEALGFSATEVAKRMQEDAQGTIVDVFEALSEMAPEDQRSLLSMIVGEESIGVITPMLANLDGLRQSFGLMANEAAYAGSMQKEFLNRMAEADSSVGRALTAVENLAMTVGGALVPVIDVAANGIALVANSINTVAENSPNMTAAVAVTVAGLVGFKVASLGVRFALAQTRLTLAQTTAGYHRMSAAAMVARRRTTGWQPAMPSGPVTAAGKLGGVGAVMRSGGKLLAKAGGPLLAAGMMAGDVIDGVANGDAGQVGGGVGGMAGAAIGATLGSVVPVVGTIIGGAVGGFAGEWLGRMAGEWLGGDGEAEQDISAMTEDSFDGQQGLESIDFDKIAELPGVAPSSEPSMVNSNNTTTQRIELNVIQQPGEDTSAFAERVMEVVRRQTNDGALYDVE